MLRLYKISQGSCRVIREEGIRLRSSCGETLGVESLAKGSALRVKIDVVPIGGGIYEIQPGIQGVNPEEGAAA